MARPAPWIAGGPTGHGAACAPSPSPRPSQSPSRGHLAGRVPAPAGGRDRRGPAPAARCCPTGFGAAPEWPGRAAAAPRPGTARAVTACRLRWMLAAPGEAVSTAGYRRSRTGGGRALPDLFGAGRSRSPPPRSTAAGRWLLRADCPPPGPARTPPGSAWCGPGVDPGWPRDRARRRRRFAREHAQADRSARRDRGRRGPARGSPRPPATPPCRRAPPPARGWAQSGPGACWPHAPSGSPERQRRPAGRALTSAGR